MDIKGIGKPTRIYKIRRRLKFLWQKLTRGWDDSDTWALDGTIAQFAIPRLRRFKELTNGYPREITPKQWKNELDDIIYALETSQIELKTVLGPDERDWDRVERGFTLLGKRFRSLWW